jgi:hypothetical protein
MTRLDELGPRVELTFTPDRRVTGREPGVLEKSFRKLARAFLRSRRDAQCNLPNPSLTPTRIKLFLKKHSLLYLKENIASSPTSTRCEAFVVPGLE